MRVLWLCYIFIGIGAFAISFFLEFLVFTSITNNQEFALALTLVFECAKVLTIIIHRYVADKKGYTIPNSVMYLNVFFKVGLILLSLICSIAIISKDLDRPNLNAIKEKDKALIGDIYSSNLTMLTDQRDNKFEKITNEIKEKYLNRYEDLANYYEPRIESEEKLRDMEFENIINGVRKGPKWEEHDRKIKELSSEYKDEKEKLQNEENNELNSYMSSIESEFQEKIEDLNQNNSDDLMTLESNTYEDDKRVDNETVSSFLSTMEEGLGIEMGYLTFTLLFAILLSALLESTIFLTFNYVVMFQENILSKSRRPEIFENDNSDPQEKYSGARQYQDVNPNEPRPNEQSHDEIIKNRIKNISDYFNPSNADKMDNLNPCHET